MRYERIPTEDPVRAVWTRLEVLESVGGASRFLERRTGELAAETEASQVEAKAQGIAFTVRTAHEYFQVPVEGNVTNACLAYYYGALSLLQALLLADPRNELKLEDLEEFTKRGHGLRAFTEPGQPFPEREKVMVLSDGFLPRFLRAAGYDVDLGTVAVSRGYDTVAEAPEEERDRIISVRDLLNRIPELRSLQVEILGDAPGYIYLNRVGNESATRLHFSRNNNWPGMDQTWIRQILEWNDQIALEEDEDEIRTEWKPLNELLVEPLHASVMANSAYVQPILGISDVYVIEFILLYALSIWVRYRPACGEKSAKEPKTISAQS